MTILAVWISVEFRFRVLFVKVMSDFAVVSFPVEMKRRPSVCDDVRSSSQTAQEEENQGWRMPGAQIFVMRSEGMWGRFHSGSVFTGWDGQCW
jgi:hypothetical protein